MSVEMHTPLRHETLRLLVGFIRSLRRSVANLRALLRCLFYSRSESGDFYTSCKYFSARHVDGTVSTHSAIPLSLIFRPHLHAESFEDHIFCRVFPSVLIYQ